MRGCEYDEMREKAYEDGWNACAEETWDDCYNHGYVWGYDRGWEDAKGGHEYDETPVGEYGGY